MSKNRIKKSYKVAIIGLGYVGLPLAFEFGKKLPTIGYDISTKRIKKLKERFDETNFLNNKKFKDAKNLFFSNRLKDIKNCNYKILALPTPVNKNKKPDLKILQNACRMVGTQIKKDDLIVIESTVYPGATNKICVSLLEKYSKLKNKIDFYVAYSPERINPGDTKNNLKSIVKIVSSDNKIGLKKVKNIYRKINLNIFVAKDIITAESAKIIENVQRDVNIALVNEFAQLFTKLNIETNKVLEAAGTKWNFLKFKPGLVGGHCIGVDPYYLKYKSDLANYNSRLITIGRDINENFSKFISKIVYKHLNAKNSKNVSVFGMTYKENIPDYRNSKIFDLVKYLKNKNLNVDIYDPYINLGNKKLFKGFKVKMFNKKKMSDLLLVCVSHSIFKKNLKKMCKLHLKKGGIFFDLKSEFSKAKIVSLGYRYYSL